MIYFIVYSNIFDDFKLNFSLIGYYLFTCNTSMAHQVDTLHIRNQWSTTKDIMLMSC